MGHEPVIRYTQALLSVFINYQVCSIIMFQAVPVLEGISAGDNFKPSTNELENNFKFNEIKLSSGGYNYWSPHKIRPNDERINGNIEKEETTNEVRITQR